MLVCANGESCLLLTRIPSLVRTTSATSLALILHHLPPIPITYIFRQEVNGELRTYQISRLPQNLILHFKRFERNNFTFEKNPTIVNFPVRAVDVRALLAPGSPAAREAEGGGGGAMGAVYDLVANVCHGGKAPAAAASTSSGGGGVYKVHVLDKVGEQQWYQIQDLLVEETIPQTIFLAESYIQVGLVVACER